MLHEDIQVSARPVGHLPLICAATDQLGFLDIIDQVSPIHPLGRVSDADCVMALVLRILSGRPTLYRVDEFLGRLDTEVLFGPGIQADMINDTRLGKALDRLDQIGTDYILSKVAEKYLAKDPDGARFTVHHDTTSVSLFGVYDTDSDLVPARGFSKDHRPDLKQLIYGLTLHGSAGIPLVATVVGGNAADSTVARDHLTKLVDMLPEKHEVTFVGDCKLVDQFTVGRLLAAGLHFVSLVPNSFAVRGELVEQAWADHPDPTSWPILGTKPGRSKKESATFYRGISYSRPFQTRVEREGEATFVDLRFVVVYSGALAARFNASLGAKLDKERTAFEKQLARLNRKGFDCESDAVAAAQREAKKLRYHSPSIATESQVVPAKRARPGRPRKGEKPPTKTVWRLNVELNVDTERVEAASRRASCFVLVTDWTQQKWPDARVLAEYRHQHLVEGHTGFRWLKGPAAVAPVFLKSPRRIRAMGLIFILALMVRNYIQATIRAQLKARKETIRHPFTKQPQRNLTPEMAFEHLTGLCTRVITLGEHTRRLPMLLSEPARQLLALFGFDERIFLPVERHRRKWRRPPRETPGM